MLPETGAAADASVASELNDAQASEDQQVEHEQHEQEHESVGARADAVLKELGITDEVRELVKPKSTDENETAENTTAAEEDAGAGRTEGETGKKAEVESKKPGEEEDEDPPLTPEQEQSAPWALPRIHKLTAQKNAEKAGRVKAEQEKAQAIQVVQQLHQQLQGATRRRLEPTERDPLAHVSTIEDLRTEVQDIDEMLYFAEQNPDGITEVLVGVDAEGKPVTRDFSAKQIAAIKAEFGRRQRHLPVKAGRLQEQQQHEQFARATLPEMFQEGTVEFNARQQLQENVPELYERLPGADQWVGWSLFGREIISTGLTVAEVRAALAPLAAAKKKSGGDKNGKVVKKVDPKVAPFLTKHPPMAPGVPGASSLPRDPAGGAARSTDTSKAVERFAAEGGEDKALEHLVAELSASQAPDRQEVLV